MGISNMKLLILSTIFISSISSFRISESEAKLVLSRERRWGRSNEEKTDDKMKKRCGKSTCDFEEWAETAENYKADGWDEENVRTPEKMELFDQMYTQCVGGATGKSQEVREKRVDCVMNVKRLFNEWPTPAPTTAQEATTTDVTTQKPTTADPTTTQAVSEAHTTPDATTTSKPTTASTTEQQTTTTKQATTTDEPTTTNQPTTTSQPTTTVEATTTTTKGWKGNLMTSDWATTAAPRRNKYR